MTTRRVLGLMALMVLFTGSASVRSLRAAADDKVAQAPTLTVEQKQAIQILAQRIELAQLRAQAAQTEFDKARGELAAVLKSLQKDGFDLDLQSMAYVKKPDQPTPPAETKKKDGST